MSPSQVRWVRRPCALRAHVEVTQKHGKYDKSFAETNYSFCAMVWETLGALNSEGEEVLRQIFRFAAKQLGCEFSSYCGRAWARISCCLQRSVGQAILNRIDGREFRDPLTLSGPDSMTDLASPALDGPRGATLPSSPLLPQPPALSSLTSSSQPSPLSPPRYPLPLRSHLSPLPARRCLLPTPVRTPLPLPSARFLHLPRLLRASCPSRRMAIAVFTWPAS